MSPQYLGSTSIDLVQHQTYTFQSLPGLKRPREQINSESQRLQEPRVFNDVSNITSALAHHRHQRLGSRERNRIEASEILKVSARDPFIGNSPGEFHGKTVISTPVSSLNPLLSLSHSRYGLPATLVENFSSLGIQSIYPWQSSCLLGRGLLTGEKNLVYTAPTGGGKSLVADVLMLKRVIEDRTKKAILVLPYVALVQEKLKWLRKVVEGVKKASDPISQSSSQLPRWRKRHPSDSVRVVGFFGGSKTRATWSDVDVAVCTIEKVKSATRTEGDNNQVLLRLFPGKLSREHGY